MIGVIAQRELRGLYLTGTPWLLLAVSQFVLGWLGFRQLEIYQRIEPALTAQGAEFGIWKLVVEPGFRVAALLLLIIIPLLAMRSLSQELASGRIALYLSSPVDPLQLIIGKWLGLIIAVLPVPLLNLTMALLLGLGSDLDAGGLAGAGLGLLLLTAMATAISLLCSSLTSQMALAGLLGCAALFLLWLPEPETAMGLGDWLALNPHFSPLSQGLLRLQDLAYFAGLTVTGLGLTWYRLWRLGGGE